jgi:hypothetical protein
VPQKRSKPRALVAKEPDQIYCWDITYLPTEVRGLFFYLYLFVDIFSRKVVGWQVFDCESAEKSAALLEDICRRQGIRANQVTVHSDNGGPMKGETMLATMQRLGVAHSRSRPAVSNDNPYAESLFKTLKYRPQLPLKPFADLLHARRWVTELVHWYNEQLDVGDVATPELIGRLGVEAPLHQVGRHRQAVAAVGGHHELAFGLGPMPCCFMSLRTRSLPTRMPRASSSLCMRGQPYSPLTSAWMARM